VTPQDVVRIIEEDLTRGGATLVWLGRPLRECLQVPVRRRFLNSHSNNEPEDLWFVFEEGPNSGEGYKVVYDEDLGEFGLAVQGVTEPVLIGYYGGFVETLNSM